MEIHLSEINGILIAKIENLIKIMKNLGIFLLMKKMIDDSSKQKNIIIFLKNFDTQQIENKLSISSIIL
jgi:hypothetical protein